MAQSITEAIGVNEKWYNELHPKVLEGLKSKELISDVINELADDVRTECFGEVNNVELSDYEKKLLMVGYLIGLTRGQFSANPFSFIEHLFGAQPKEEGDE